MNYRWLTIILILIVLGARAQECSQEFEKYVTEFNKSYNNAAQRSEHEKYFCQNLKKIEACNKNTTLTYTCGLNSMTDQPPTPKLSTKKPTERKASTQSPSRVGLPDSLDWRDTNLVTTIKNQYNCGACWAFAGAAAAETKLIEEERQTRQKADLSEQYLLECTAGSTCNGGYMEEVMKQITSQGVPHEDDFPYDPFTTHFGICATYGYHIAHENTDYYDLSNDQIIQLLQQGPLAIGIASGGWINYNSGVFQCDPLAIVDHAVQLVGYTPTEWIVKNQWGQNWGQDGFIRISRTLGVDCSIGSQAHVLYSSQFIATVMVVLIFILLS